MENKYLLKQNEEDEGVLCRIVTIDGFDYYVSDSPRGSNYIIWLEGTPKLTYATLITSTLYSGGHAENWKRVIATNNPNIHIPKVVDEVERLAEHEFQEQKESYENSTEMFPFDDSELLATGFQIGYNKCKEIHPNSDKDTIEFANWLRQEDTEANAEKYANFTDADMLQFWKEQQPKIVYYE